MIVSEFIEELKAWDQDLKVCLGDWAGLHTFPSMIQAEKIRLVYSEYRDLNNEVQSTDNILLIGKDFQFE
tara:strand:+ start:319 stop:528 length:210 start_codon:yes stop_codon:yes gene_type:complete